MLYRWLIVILMSLCSCGSLFAQSPSVKLEEEISGHKGIKPYTQPGIVSYKAGRWIGNDHLYNLSDNIHIVAQVLVPENFDLTVSGDLLRSRAEALLRKSGINPYSPANDAEAVLPFLHILLIVYPVDGGFATSCSIRLFESVGLSRVKVEGGVAWQGITWEKQKLIIVGKDQLVDSINVTVDDILNDFVKRYLFYKKLKSYLQNQA